MQIIENKKQFQQALLAWFNEEQRDLPWRQTNNPYYIWVSEVMLQQTRVDTVIPYYNRFIEKFPTMKTLAEAEENELLKMWEGLGYYSRARNLQAGVREVLTTYNGVIPDNRKAISTLKGVGPYTAGAILSIAYNVPEHAVDGNVMRVLSRILLIEEDIAKPATRKIFEQVVMDLIDEQNPSAFNQGLMELGATICTPHPRCLLCPVRDFCSAFEAGKQEELPIKTKKTKMRIEEVASFALRTSNGQWVLQQRPAKGLLANLWEFPMVELTGTEGVLAQFERTYDVSLLQMKKIDSFKHVFSHITWQLTGYVAVVSEETSLPKEFQLFTADEVERLPKPVPVLKLWETLQRGDAL